MAIPWSRQRIRGGRESLTNGFKKQIENRVVMLKKEGALPQSRAEDHLLSQRKGLRKISLDRAKDLSFKCEQSLDARIESIQERLKCGQFRVFADDLKRRATGAQDRVVAGP